MIVINIDKAKEIAHEIRRTKRAEEFAPLDIKAVIPSEAATAEISRQAVREKYSTMQQSIDSATSVEQLKQLIQ